MGSAGLNDEDENDEIRVGWVRAEVEKAAHSVWTVGCVTDRNGS